jgi:hypothetical protein
VFYVNSRHRISIFSKLVYENWKLRSTVYDQKELLHVHLQLAHETNLHGSKSVTLHDLSFGRFPFHTAIMTIRMVRFYRGSVTLVQNTGSQCFYCSTRKSQNRNLSMCSFLQMKFSFGFPNKDRGWLIWSSIFYKQSASSGSLGIKYLYKEWFQKKDGESYFLHLPCQYSQVPNSF